VNLNIGTAIQLAEDTDLSNLKITIYMENLEEKSEKRTTPVSEDEEYRYCFEARPGKYLVYPVV
jgi:hypothetical protein